MSCSDVPVHQASALIGTWAVSSRVVQVICTACSLLYLYLSSIGEKMAFVHQMLQNDHVIPVGDGTSNGNLDCIEDVEGLCIPKRCVARPPSPFHRSHWADIAQQNAAE